MSEKLIMGWQQIPSPYVSLILSDNSGYDGVVLDVEHGGFDHRSLLECILAVKTNEKEVFVRLPRLDWGMLQYSLDCHVDGVIMATIETAEEAQEFYDRSLYSRKRGQGLVVDNRWNDCNLAKDRNRRDDNLKIIPMIETVIGGRNIGFMEKLPFFSFLVGPYDLSSSLGIPGQFNDPLFVSSLNTICQVVGQDRMGIHVVKEESFAQASSYNYNFIALGMDTTLLKHSTMKNSDYIENNLRNS